MEERNRRIFEMWLACATDEEIGQAVGLSDRAVAAIRQETEESEAVQKLRVLADYREPKGRRAGRTGERVACGLGANRVDSATKGKPHDVSGVWGTVNRRGRLTGEAYHEDRLPASMGRRSFAMCKLCTFLGRPACQQTELRFPVAASTVTWWLEGSALGVSWEQAQDGPVTHLTAYGYNSEQDWPYDDVADEDLECRAAFEVLELAPNACRVVARWLSGREHEDWPVYEGLLAELRQTLGGSQASSPTCIDELCQGEDVEAEAVNAAQATAVRPSEPAKPSPRAGLDAWFDWYHAMKGAGYHCTLGDVARETGYSEGHIRHEHRSYKLRRGRLPQKTH